jgi:hypothetical protein
MSAVNTEKAIKRITKKSVFLLWSADDAIMTDSHPLFACRLSKINGRVKKNLLHGIALIH